MNDIDYEAIHRAVWKEFSNDAAELGFIQAVITAYEAQKQPPEWVPLDLEKVKQGQEVTLKHWGVTPPSRFVCVYKKTIVVEQGDSIAHYELAHEDWIMRAPKPKTVRVRVFKTGAGVYEAATGDANRLGLVGEGDIEVQG